MNKGAGYRHDARSEERQSLENVQTMDARRRKQQASNVLAVRLEAGVPR